jgi:hypothetical protein
MLWQSGDEGRERAIRFVDERVWESEGKLPGHDIAHLNWLANAYDQMGQHPEAMQARLRAFKIKPGFDAYLQFKQAATRPEIDPNRIATYGSGGTGGGNAVYVAAIDPRVKCAVCYLGISNGWDWLRSMRREYEWLDYLKRVDQDRKKRVLTGSGEIVSAREEIMVQTPERQTTTIKKEVEAKIPNQMPLRCAEAIMEYSPEEVVHKIAPRGVLFIAVEHDAVTPEAQSVRLYEKAGEPKKLVLYKQTTHYGIYNDYFDDVAANVVDWYNRHLKYHKVEITEQA